MSNKKAETKVRALKVHQWLSDWNEIKWSTEDHAAEPRHWFYQFSLAARDLKALSGIYPRTVQRRRGTADLGIQRRHEVERSSEISKFVRYGYPWSELSQAKRSSGEFRDLRQPGWLPTAIVVNILTDGDERVGKRIGKNDLIEVSDKDDGTAEIRLPNGFKGSTWRHTTIPPLEVIDGQHRLWAFEEANLDGDFELPVVAFVGLDLRWQAYLFYTINIKPKKINASLAFDLYPLLRTQEWLTKFEGHVIYREARAQELVDLLWSHVDSPWHHRINMLGEKGYKGKMVTQAAWVRSLLASFVKSWESPNTRIGGLFGSVVGQHQGVLPWSRTEQAAFLIVAGLKVRDAISKTKKPWAKALRNQAAPTLFEGDDAAFYGPNSLLNQDQGTRILLQILNDLLYVRADVLSLDTWGGEQRESENDETEISRSASSLRRKRSIIQYIEQIAEALARYDWRSSDAPGLSGEEKSHKASFRGSGGYKVLRHDVLGEISKGQGTVPDAARDVIQLLGY